MAVAVGSPLVYRQKWAFVVEIETVVVGRFSKAGPLKQSVTLQAQKSGGAPFPVDYTPTEFKQPPVTLERGASNNNELWTWWDAIRSGKMDRRSVTISWVDAKQNPLGVWVLSNSSITDFDAGDFDAKNDTENAIEKIVIQPYYLEQSRLVSLD